MFNKKGLDGSLQGLSSKVSCSVVDEETRGSGRKSFFSANRAKESRLLVRLAWRQQAQGTGQLGEEGANPWCPH